MLIGSLRLSCLAAFAAWSLPVATLAAPEAPTTIATQSGKLLGESAAAVRVFKGIPFAAPPVGALRWRAPQPAAHWRGTRDARLWGPVCPQPTAPGMNSVPAGQRMSEDCLYLNVWAPAGATGRAPVMVWIHGGALVMGAGSFPEFDGSAFARDGVVLVTLNYRLGALGFFAHRALTAEASAKAPLGNYGLMDQLAALAWVKRNIARFGGDPHNVTLFGESAGASSLTHLLAAPAARGLFHKAIIESAPAFGPEKSLADAERDGARLATTAGAPPNATVAQLRALPFAKLLAAEPMSSVAPFVDGRFIPEPPMRAIARGESLPVSMIIGSNSDEGSLIDEGFRDAPRIIASLVSPNQAAAARQIYGVASIDDPRFARESFGDLIFGASARWIAARQSLRAPTFLYSYDYVWTAKRGHVPGAPHSAEMLMVFDTLDQHHGQVTDQDRAESRVLHGCWVSFAKTGTPDCRNGPRWIAYTAANESLMDFASDGMAIEPDYRKSQLDFWQPVGLRLSGASQAK